MKNGGLDWIILKLQLSTVNLLCSIRILQNLKTEDRHWMVVHSVLRKAKKESMIHCLSWSADQSGEDLEC